MTTSSEPKSPKQAIREASHAARNALTDKDIRSETILQKFLQLPEYLSARVAMFYIDVRSEVRTRQALPSALASGKTIIVPWCNAAGELELFHLESMEELELGMYKILEPRKDLRDLPAKKREPKDLDIVMVPGVAFDARGGRTGHGKGYYDKLLQHARKDCPLVALAFDCQIFPEIPMDEHDIFMDKVVTETQIHTGRGRK